MKFPQSPKPPKAPKVLGLPWTKLLVLRDWFWWASGIRCRLWGFGGF